MPGPNRTDTSAERAAGGHRPAVEPVARRDRAGDERGAGGRSRGQTTLDFSIGVAIFLSAMIFTFAFAPGILSPFTTGDQQNTVTVDRTANHLGQDLLGSPTEPYVLDRHCTVAYFDPGGSDNGCRWESGSLTDQLGIESFTNVRITITGDVDGDTVSNQLYWHNDDHELTESSSGDVVSLEKGGTPPPRNDNAVTAQRVASLATHDVTIRVVMW